MGWFALLIALLAPDAWSAETGRSWCFPSGLKVAVEPREGAPLVGIATVIDGGSSTEQRGEEGAAHLLEHLWFRSPRMGYASVDDLLDNIGSEANAYTTHDETEFVTVAHKRAIRTLLTLESARLMDPLGTIAPEVLETERRVVQNEISERYEGRDPALAAVVRRLVPEEHPYARTVSGTLEQVGAVDMVDLRAYAERHYIPSRTTVYVAGDLPSQAVYRLITTTLDRSLLAAPIAPEAITPKPCTMEDHARFDDLKDPPTLPWDEVEAGVDQPLAVVAWSVPPGFVSRNHAETAAELMEWHLRKATPLDASCTVVPMESATVLTCASSSKKARSEEAWQRGAKAIERLWRQALDKYDSKSDYWDAVVKAARRQSNSRARARLEQLDTVGHLPASALSFHRYAGLTPPDLASSEAAATWGQQWVTRERMRGLLLVPSAARRTETAGFHGGRGMAHVPPDAPGVVDLARLQEAVVDPGLGAIDARVVANRPVWVLSRSGIHDVRVAAVYPGDEGWSDEALRQRAWQLLEDPWDLIAGEARDRAFQRGIQLWMEDAGSWWAFLATGPHPENTVRALKAVTPPPTRFIPQAEDKAMAEKLEAWRTEAIGNARWRAAHLRWKALADGIPHPYMDPEAFDALRAIPRPEASRFASRYLSPRRARIVAVVPPDQVDATHQAIARAFGQAEAGVDSDLGVPPNAKSEPRNVHLVPADDPGPQATVIAECHVEDGDTVDQWVLERVLGDALNDALRNDLGLTYGVHPRFQWRAHGLTLEVETRVPHDASGIAAKAILQTLTRVAEDRLDPAEIDRHKLEVARGTALRWQSAESVLGLLEGAAASGRDPGDLGLAERLDEVDGPRLAGRLAPCVGHEAVTVVGEPERLSRALTEAGLDWTRWRPEEPAE